MSRETKEKPELVKAFNSLGIWHVRSVFSPNGYPYWTPKSEEDMFSFLYKEGYKLKTISEGDYFFELTPTL